MYWKCYACRFHHHCWIPFPCLHHLLSPQSAEVSVYSVYLRFYLAHQYFFSKDLLFHCAKVISLPQNLLLCHMCHSSFHHGPVPSWVSQLWGFIFKQLVRTWLVIFEFKSFLCKWILFYLFFYICTHLMCSILSSIDCFTNWCHWNIW